jgi:starvation-inducible outer membrane lipoprotein
MKYLSIGLMLLLAACKSYPQPLAGADPADPSAPVAPVRYQSSLGAYVSQRPVGPGDWREQNRRVTPPSQQ